MGGKEGNGQGKSMFRYMKLLGEMWSLCLVHELGRIRASTTMEICSGYQI